MAEQLITDAQMLARIKAFCDSHDLTPTRFGRDAISDGSLIPNLEKGRSLTLRNVARIESFMATYRPESAAA